MFFKVILFKHDCTGLSKTKTTNCSLVQLWIIYEKLWSRIGNRWIWIVRVNMYFLRFFVRLLLTYFSLFFSKNCSFHILSGTKRNVYEIYICAGHHSFAFVCFYSQRTYSIVGWMHSICFIVPIKTDSVTTLCVRTVILYILYESFDMRFMFVFSLSQNAVVAAAFLFRDFFDSN